MNTKTGGLPRAEVPWRQLWMIARRVIEAEPTIDDAEWAARIHDRIARDGFDYPQPHVITDAMRQIEKALRLDRSPQLPLMKPTDRQPEPSGLSHAEACAALDQLHQRFGPLPAMKPREMPPASPGDDERRQRERYHVVHIVEQLREMRRQRALISPTLDSSAPSALAASLHWPRCPQCGEYVLEGRDTCGQPICQERRCR